jgi:hypothetical protein
VTTPWTPSPNPGGQHRRLVRTVVQQWIKAQQIQGLDRVYRSVPPEVLMTEYASGSTYACQVMVVVDDTSQSFDALTGPTDPGGYQATRSVRLLVRHRAFEISEGDWDDAQDDHDRIVDALEDCLRGNGRDLGRPDVILASAVTPREAAIITTMDPPVYGNGNRDQWSEIQFNVIQYIQRQP